MRLNVVYDDERTILAAAIAGNDGDRPLPKEGERADEYNMPDELAGSELHQIIERLQVDIKPNKLTQRSPGFPHILSPGCLTAR